MCMSCAYKSKEIRRITSGENLTAISMSDISHVIEILYVKQKNKSYRL